MGYQAAFRVWRGDADGGDLHDYTVEANEGEVVLDVVHRLQATQTPDLAVRWNCKAGKCGSCSAEINGRPRLMCMTRMSTFDPDETITVTADDAEAGISLGVALADRGRIVRRGVVGDQDLQVRVRLRSQSVERLDHERWQTSRGPQLTGSIPVHGTARSPCIHVLAPPVKSIVSPVT